MAFGFAGAAAGAAESLDTLLAKRRAEALAQQELEQRRVTEARMREVADAQMAEMGAQRAERERQTGRTEALERLALVPVGGIVPPAAVDAANKYGLGGNLRDEMITPSGPRLPGGSNENWEPYSTGVVRRIPTETERLLEAKIALDREVKREGEARADKRVGMNVAGQYARSMMQISAQDARAAFDRVPPGVQDYIGQFVGSTRPGVGKKYWDSERGVERPYTNAEAWSEIQATFPKLRDDHPNLSQEAVRKLLDLILPPPETNDLFGAGGGIFGQTGSNNTNSSGFTLLEE